MISLQKPQLFVFHFAGGSCYSFQELLPHIKNMEVHQIELPGRGKRMAEDLIDTAEIAALDLLKHVKARLSGSPFIIYGHSMGATLGLKVTSLLETEGISPECLIVSGNAGPGITKEILRYNLPDKEFKEELIELGGIPDEFLNSTELFEFFEPILRSDFKLVETSEIEIDQPLNCKIHAMMGNEEITADKIENWQRFTSKQLTSELLQGGHFFINEYMEYIAQTIEKELLTHQKNS